MRLASRRISSAVVDTNLAADMPTATGLESIPKESRPKKAGSEIGCTSPAERVENELSRPGTFLKDAHGEGEWKHCEIGTYPV